MLAGSLVIGGMSIGCSPFPSLPYPRRIRCVLIVGEFVLYALLVIAKAVRNPRTHPATGRLLRLRLAMTEVHLEFISSPAVLSLPSCPHRHCE
jgi:hypothetical protein